MSAYMVADSTINKIVAYFEMATRGSETWPVRPIAEAGYNLMEDDECERLARDMFQLNIDGVEARYGKGEAKEFRPLDFTYQFIFLPPTLHALKALHCWQYQCTEGNVPETELYQLMEEVSARMCQRIVSDLPGYQSAPWA